MRSGFFKLGVLLAALIVVPTMAWARGGGGGHGGGGGGGHGGGGHGGGGHGGGGHGGGGHGGGGHGGGGHGGGGGGFHGGGGHAGGFHGAGGFGGGHPGGFHAAGPRAGGGALHAQGAARNFSSHASNFAHSGQRPNAGFSQRNFGAGSRSGINSLQRSSASVSHGNLAGRNNANFVQQHFGANTHLGGQSLQRQSNFANRNFAHNNFAHGANLASFSGSRAGHNLGAGHLHQSLFNGGNLHHNVTSNFARNVNVNTNVNRNFNSRWSGGWNRWGNRSFFFGVGSPFGGFYRGYYPWYGYGFRRFGFGSGYYPYYYGYGYGYPNYYGYPGYSYGSYLSYYPYYNNYGTYGYGNYAYGGSSCPATYGSYGYPSGTTTYNSYAAATTPYGPDNSSYASAPLPTAGNVIGATAPGPSPVADDAIPQSAPPETAPRSVDDITAADFAGQGEIDFKGGTYETAARNFRHALVDDPSNSGVLMLLGQALFATGQYDEAAGATAMAMQSLPPDKWGAVLKNYQQLYGHPGDYTSQLGALEKARDAKPDSPALHFLLGFQYGFSGHASQAIAELDKTIQFEPKDQMAKALRDQLAGNLKGSTGQNPAAPFNAPAKASGVPQLPGGELR